MPFAGYKDFEDCVSKTMSKKGLNKKRASAYCASIARKAGENLKSNELKIKFMSEDLSYSLLLNDKVAVDLISSSHIRLQKKPRAILLTHYDDEIRDGLHKMVFNNKISLYGFKSTLNMYMNRLNPKFIIPSPW